MCLEISHLLYANDIIIFCDNYCEEIISLRCTLIWFETISGFKGNPIEVLYSTDGGSGEHSCYCRHFAVRNPSFIVLGLPLGAKYKEKSIPL